MVKVNNKGEETMSQVNGPSSLDSDGSFVVLERSTTQDHSLYPNGAPLQSLRSLPPSTMDETQENNAPPSYLPGSISSLSLDEIQKKLQEVVQENVELKETLQQNNLAMKQQFNTLIMWQEEVYKVHQNHKEKFQETKELILKLRAENSELKNYLEKCGSTSDTQLKEENAKLKGQIAELQQKLSAPIPRPHTAPTKKEEELSDLVKQLNTQLETAQRSRRQLGLDVESLTARRVKNEREIAELKCALQQLVQKNAELEQKLLQHEQDVGSMVVVEKMEDSVAYSKLQTMNVELQMGKSQLMELKAQLDQEKQEKSSLLSQMQQQEAVLQDLQKKLQTQTNGKSKNSSTPGKENVLFVKCEEQLKKLNGILSRQTDRYANLDNWLQNSSSSIEQWRPNLHGNDTQTLLSLRAQMEQLMKILAQEQAYSQEIKLLFDENESNFQKLFLDYQTSLQDWQTLNQEESDKARYNADYLTVQSKGFTEKIDHLMAQVLCKEEELKESEKESLGLKEKVKKLELENEAIAILKAQVEVYQSDFNAEREARESLAGEKDRVAEDLRHLQRRNQQLLDDLESYQRAQFDVLQNTSNLSGNNWHPTASRGRGSVSPNRLNVVFQPNSSAVDLKQRASPEVEPSPPRMYDEEVPPPKEYVCPMCRMAFRQLQQLEYHVETCLDS